MQQKTPHSYSHGAWAAGDQRMVFVVTFGNAIAPRGRLLLCDLSNRRERGWEGGQISAPLRLVLEGAHKGRKGGLGDGVITGRTRVLSAVWRAATGHSAPRVGLCLDLGAREACCNHMSPYHSSQPRE